MRLVFFEPRICVVAQPAVAGRTACPTSMIAKGALIEFGNQVHRYKTFQIPDAKTVSRRVWQRLKGGCKGFYRQNPLNGEALDTSKMQQRNIKHPDRSYDEWGYTITARVTLVLVGLAVRPTKCHGRYEHS